jgi:uncharacterized cupin superfamily protein
LSVVPEAPLEQTEVGLVPKGEGWFIVNATEARWFEHDAFGFGTTFEGDPEFPQLGINIGVLQPGQPACLYHRESAQENFLVLWGECVVLIEGEERPLKAWDFVHCAPWTDHVFVGAGQGTCGILAVGSREHQEIVYPVSELAQRYGASAEEETPEPRQAYARFERPTPVKYGGQLEHGS